MDNAKTATIALLGCGAVSQYYYTPALKSLEKRRLLQVKALFDPNSARTAQLNKVFRSAICLRNLSELSQLDIDLAIVASPPGYHAEQAIELLKSGVSVLCEKPMAGTVGEGEAMVEAAGAARGVLAIGLYRRFFSATQAIRDLLSLQLLGEIKSFYFSEGGIFRWPVKCSSFFKRATAQGGVLLDIGVHVLDLLIWWLGEAAEVRYEDDAIGGVEANCRITLKFSAGFSGEVRLSRDCSIPSRYVIECTKGWLGWNVHEGDIIELGLDETRLSIRTGVYGNKCKNMSTVKLQSAASLEEAFVGQIYNVLAAIQGKEQLVVPGEEGLKSIRLMEKCYRQRALMPMPWFSDREYARALQVSTQTLSC